MKSSAIEYACCFIRLDTQRIQGRNNYPEIKKIWRASENMFHNFILKHGNEFHKNNNNILEIYSWIVSGIKSFANLICFSYYTFAVVLLYFVRFCLLNKYGLQTPREISFAFAKFLNSYKWRKRRKKDDKPLSW